MILTINKMKKKLKKAQIFLIQPVKCEKNIKMANKFKLEIILKKRM